jgi:hypothetical protein
MWSLGQVFCGGQSGIKAGFLQILQFPLPILIPLATPNALTVLSATLYILDAESRWVTTFK